MPRFALSVRGRGNNPLNRQRGVQDLFQVEMDEDGYFEPCNEQA
jgi:hypothetical protein